MKLADWDPKTDINAVQGKAAELLASILDGSYQTPSETVDDGLGTMLWTDLLAEHTRLAGIRPATAKQYQYAVQAFQKRLPKAVADLDGPAWRKAFQDAISSGQLTEKTASTYAQCLRSMWETWAFSHPEAGRRSTRSAPECRRARVDHCGPCPLQRMVTSQLIALGTGYRPPAPEAIVPMDQRPIMH